MKRALLVLLALCLSAPVASADYYDPPGWDNEYNFTHQGWQFNDGTSPKDAEVDANPFGLATAYELNNHGVWQDSLGQEWTLDTPPQFVRERTGGWLFQGPVEDIFGSITVPNEFDSELKKEIWFQATFKTNNPGGPTVGVAAFDDLGNPFTMTDWKYEVFGQDVHDGTVWARATVWAEISPQPGSETIVFSANLDQGEYMLVDQVDIDSRCVPEPLTVVMLGAGALCLAGYAWRRRKGAT